MFLTSNLNILINIINNIKNSISIIISSNKSNNQVDEDHLINDHFAILDKIV